MDIHFRIKELREQKKLSKKDFAAKIGVDNSQYGKFETGKLTPTIQHLMEISSNFGISVDWLLTGEGDMFKGGTREPDATTSSGVGDSYIYKELLGDIKELSKEVGGLKAENNILRRENDSLRKKNANLTDELEQLKNTVIVVQNTGASGVPDMPPQHVPLAVKRKNTTKKRINV
jgi:transcriptional regulator with XRE-family HTH domain